MTELKPRSGTMVTVTPPDGSDPFPAFLLRFDGPEGMLAHLRQEDPIRGAFELVVAVKDDGTPGRRVYELSYSDAQADEVRLWARLVIASSTDPESAAAKLDDIERRWERGHGAATPLFREVLALARALASGPLDVGRIVLDASARPKIADVARCLEQDSIGYRATPPELRADLARYAALLRSAIIDDPPRAPRIPGEPTRFPE